jgi:predicted GNAT family N-acyltransferase
MSIDDFDIRVANWAEDKADLAKIRRSVFIEEQNVPEELEWDEYDDLSTHFIATHNRRPVATARLKPDGQIGRMAVLREYRHQGIGRKLLQYILQLAASRQLEQLYLHAQVEALPFYEKQGFSAHGEVFYEADIPHRAMAKKLPMFYKLGETNTEIHIETAEENKNTAISLVKQARYSIDIFTQDMDAEIYNNKAFEQSIFNLARKHPNSRIRILTNDSRKSVQNGHCLVRLAQNLTSSVFIHNPARQHQHEQCAFLVVDKVGLLYRVTATSRNYKASVNFKSPQRAGKLVDFFNEVWEHSTPDMQTRRIYM